ncbi:MAG: Hsp20/alpha crystallin family protein [Bacteroidales bacterium]
MRELHRLLLASEARELSDEIGRMFEDIARTAGRRLPAGETTPPLDVLETASTVEIHVDLPGVQATEVRVLIKSGVVLVAGEKLPPDAGARAGGSFHLVERGFGRFARAIRLTGAFDGSRAKATFSDGELRIEIPKIAERRGREIAVPINEAPASDGA